jgi:hypothetical protein
LAHLILTSACFFPAIFFFIVLTGCCAVFEVFLQVLDNGSDGGVLEHNKGGNVPFNAKKICLSTTRTSRNQKGTGLSGKLQITNYKQITIPKLQITNKEVSCGQILNAFGEEHTTTFLILKSWEKFFGL